MIPSRWRRFIFIRQRPFLNKMMAAKRPADPFHLRPMTLMDIPQVEAIDQAVFSKPWPENAYRYELTRNKGSVCWVAEHLGADDRSEVVGMIVIWLALCEAHVGTLAVHPSFQRQGLGRRLLARALLSCVQMGASLATLEVRRSNLSAQRLYERFNFKSVGILKGYYKDNQEDAIVMHLLPLTAENLAALLDSSGKSSL